MKLYWKVKINGKWTFRAATVKRFDQNIEITPTHGFLKNHQAGYIVQPFDGDVIDES